MNDCTLKWILISACLLIALIGLLLAFIRERKNIDKGNPDIQDGSGNLKEGSFSFKFAIGLALIVIGLFGAIYCSKNLAGCEGQKIDPIIDTKDTTSKKTTTDTAKLKQHDTINISKPSKEKNLIIEKEIVLTGEADSEPKISVTCECNIQFYDNQLVIKRARCNIISNSKDDVLIKNLRFGLLKEISENNSQSKTEFISKSNIKTINEPLHSYKVRSNETENYLVKLKNNSDINIYNYKLGAIIEYEYNSSVRALGYPPFKVILKSKDDPF